MTDQGLTAPESVEKSIGMCRLHGLHNTEATLRALSAALEAEKASHTATLKDAQDECARAEAAEAKLKEAVEVMQRIKDYRYDPNIGIELNRLEAHLSSLEGDKPDE